jgi:hypothetical protein
VGDEAPIHTTTTCLIPLSFNYISYPILRPSCSVWIQTLMGVLWSHICRFHYRLLWMWTDQSASSPKHALTSRHSEICGDLWSTYAPFLDFIKIHYFPFLVHQFVQKWVLHFKSIWFRGRVVSIYFQQANPEAWLSVGGYFSEPRNRWWMCRPI